ncbi:hypothetical protein [Skermanella pratensis]|uniref:hypothetical protein n=1 Tax=Skermanella pratensis TaxID=2233999 RepID=UPI0017881EFB|nr:hypothetical protein [Skermanella pratensis]
MVNARLAARIHYLAFLDGIIQPMNILQQVAPIISNPITIAAVIGVLVIWAGLSGWKLQSRSKHLVRALDLAREELEKASDVAAFSNRYPETDAALERNSVLGSRWREFRESLLIPHTSGRPIRTTSRPEVWFDLGLLRVPGIDIDLRYHAAMPNLLVGAGLLFTFIGLSAALATAGGVVTGTASVRNDALKLLLETASFKFVTSLVGMFLSIVYAVLRKRVLNGVERALDKFRTALEERIPLMTPAALQQEANALLERQNTQLETFSTELALNWELRSTIPSTSGWRSMLAH